MNSPRAALPGALLGALLFPAAGRIDVPQFWAYLGVVPPVTTGPYARVRHPGYAGAPFLLVGSGLALGSWGATAIGVLFLPLLLRRLVREDRILHEPLPGYAAYAERVRSRLLPGVW
jgi:protein-S-isoprenylcysteine O-methyltransferase Ste14